MPRLPLASPVLGQLLRADAGACWETRFTATPIRNDAARFEARSD